MQAIRLRQEQDMDMCVDYVNRIQSTRRMQAREAQEQAEFTADVLDDVYRAGKLSGIGKAICGTVFIGYAAMLAGIVIAWVF